MIDETDPKLTTVYCYECEKHILNDACYCIAFIDITNKVGSFPNGNKKAIGFCLTCWNLIAGKRYTFSKE